MGKSYIFLLPTCGEAELLGAKIARFFFQFHTFSHFLKPFPSRSFKILFYDGIFGARFVAFFGSFFGNILYCFLGQFGHFLKLF